MKAPKAMLALTLSIVLLSTGCTAQWIAIALADLPVLTQMALNIGTIVATLQSGKQISPQDAAAIQNISAEASKDLNLLAALYDDYKTNPSAGALAKIQSVIRDISGNLPALLQAAHIGDPVLSARVAAAINLILTTVSSFAQLIPVGSSATQRAVTMKRTIFLQQRPALPSPAQLRQQWNQQVCGANSELDFSSAGCTVN